MKKFLLLITKGLVVVISVILVLNAIYIKSGTQLIEGKFTDIPNSIEVCNLGSSHGEDGFMYEDYANKYNCFNFALSGQTLSYDYRMLQNYDAQLAKGCKVFIVISPFAFYGSSEDDGPDFLSKNQRYYQILEKDYIKNYDPKMDVLLNKLPLLTIDLGDKLTEFINYYVVKVWTSDSSETNYFKHTTEVDAKEDGIRKYNNYILSRQTGDGSMVVNEEEYNALLSILEHCKTNGYDAIMVTTPFLHEYNDAVSSGSSTWRTDLLSKVQELSSKYDVPYYDYSCDEEFQYAYDYFMDTTHLNYYGAKAFTKRVFEDILLQ